MSSRWRRQHPLVLATSLIPIAIVLAIGPPLATFVRESNTPNVVGWAFLGFLTLLFGFLPETRTGLTTFGERLDDAEVRYLHSIIRRTLIE